MTLGHGKDVPEPFKKKDSANQNGGGQTEVIPLLRVSQPQRNRDFADGQMWSNKSQRLPRISSAHVFSEVKEESPQIPWDTRPPELVRIQGGEEFESPLLNAVSEGNLDAVEKFMLSPLSSEAEQALNLACRKGHNCIVKYLLEKGVSVHYKEAKSRLDAVSMATYFDRGDVLESLASSGQLRTLPKVMINGLDVSLLHLSSFYGCLSAVKVFVSNDVIKISVEESDRDHWKPLHYAVSQGHLHVVRYLLQQDANPNAEGLYKVRPLHIAAYKENLNMVELLLEYKADPRKVVSLNPPRYSFSFELSDLAHRKHDLLPSIVFYNAKKFSTLLHWAVAKAPTDLVKKMIDKGSSVNTHDIEGVTPLGLAVTRGNKEAINYFNERGITMSDEDKNWRRIPDEESGLCVVDTLESTQLESLDCSNREGFSMLHLAASKGYLSLLNRLLNRGVNPNLESVRGETPIFYAVRHNHQACVQQLVRGGCNVCHISQNNASVLHSAAKYNNFAAIDIILKAISDGKKLDINLADENGFTAIYYAINAGRYDIVQRFVQFCVSESIHVKATKDETLLQFYTERNILGQYDNAIVRVLELEKALHCSKNNSEKCIRMQLGTTDASTKAREQLQAMYESTKVQVHCWSFWIVITCFFLPSILFFLDVYTDVVLAVEYFNDYVEVTRNGTGEPPRIDKPLEILFKNITESQSKINLVLTVFFIFFPMTLLSIWSFYVHVTQADILPFFRLLGRVQRGFLYFLLFIPPLGPIFSYIENCYAQIKYMNLTSEITGKMTEDDKPRSSSDRLRDYYNLKHVSQMRVAINNVLEATLESAFQLILQLYILGTQYIDLQKLHIGDLTIGSILSLTPTDDSQSRLSKQVLSVLISLVSLTWSFTAYHRFSKLGGLRILWSLPLLFAIFFQIISRAIACTVFTLAYSWRIFIMLGVHYFIVLLLKVAFEKQTEGPKAKILDCNPCFSSLRPYFYVFLGSFTSTFVYFRIQRPLADKDRLSQRHSSFLIQILFLFLALLENLILFGVGSANLNEDYDKVFKIVAGVLCLLSFIIGVILQLVYYSCFGHPWVNINGPYIDKDENGSILVSFYKEGGQTQWVIQSCGDCKQHFVEQEDNVYVPRNLSRMRSKAIANANGKRAMPNSMG